MNKKGASQANSLDQPQRWLSMLAATSAMGDLSPDISVAFAQLTFGTARTPTSTSRGGSARRGAGAAVDHVHVFRNPFT
jgi:hypothetical protein